MEFNVIYIHFSLWRQISVLLWRHLTWSTFSFHWFSFLFLGSLLFRIGFSSRITTASNACLNWGRFQFVQPVPTWLDGSVLVSNSNDSGEPLKNLELENECSSVSLLSFCHSLCWVNPEYTSSNPQEYTSNLREYRNKNSLNTTKVKHFKAQYSYEKQHKEVQSHCWVLCGGVIITVRSPRVCGM